MSDFPYVIADMKLFLLISAGKNEHYVLSMSQAVGTNTAHVQAVLVDINEMMYACEICYWFM